MNSIVFGRDKGEKSEDYCLLGRYLCHGILFTCSHITFAMVYSFYFLCFGSRRNEVNSLWEKKGRERSEGHGLFRCSLHYADFFQVSLMIKMIPQAITVHDTFIIILSRYVVCLKRMSCVT